MEVTKKIEGIAEGLPYLVPEFSLVAGIILLLILELVSNNNQLKNLVFILIGAVALILSVYVDADHTIVNGMFALGDLQRFFKVILSISLILVGFFSFSVGNELKENGEYQTMLLAVTLGGFFLVSAKNMLLFYVAIELISISSYILSTFSRKRSSYEAGIKYLLFGALSSGVMLYGISLIYGFAGSIDFATLVDINIWDTRLFIPVLLFLMGILFKISAIPMHIWTPSAYEGSPTAVAAFFSVVPKLAVIGFLIQFAYQVNWFQKEIWVFVLSGIAILTIIVGNFSALWQNNARRMLAYSSIAHSGFLLLGLVVQNEFAAQAVIFYGTVYMVMNLAAFYLVQLFENEGVETIQGFAGLGRKFALPGVLIVIVMIALTGLPPTAGFTAKLMVLSVFYDLYINSADKIFLLILLVAAFNAAVSLFYYLKIPFFMFFKPNGGKSPEIQSLKKTEIVFATFLILPLLLGFLKPDILIEIISKIDL